MGFWGNRELRIFGRELRIFGPGELRFYGSVGCVWSGAQSFGAVHGGIIAWGGAAGRGGREIGGFWRVLAVDGAV